MAVKTDVSNEADIINLVKQATDQFGQIDLFCSNAGIIGKPGGAEVSNEDWQEIFGINVLAHIYAARAVLPQMIERGEGYLLQTASAAGLLTQIGSAPYSVTKHAAVAFAEWLSITHATKASRFPASARKACGRACCWAKTARAKIFWWPDQYQRKKSPMPLLWKAWPPNAS